MERISYMTNNPIIIVIWSDTLFHTKLTDVNPFRPRSSITKLDPKEDLQLMFPKNIQLFTFLAS
jgi:hypothetical protein